MFEPLAVDWHWEPVTSPLFIFVGVVVATAILLWSFRQTSTRAPMATAVVVVLRLVSITLIGVLLCNPIARVTSDGQRPAGSVDRKAPLLLLVDTSRSMQTADSPGDGGATTTRIDAVKKWWLTPEHMDRLSRAFDVRMMRIDSAAQNVDLKNGLDAAKTKLVADGHFSALRTGLTHALEALSHVPDAHAVIFSDGHDTTGDAAPDTTNAKGVIVDAVVLGDLSGGTRGTLRLVTRGEPALLHTAEEGELTLELLGASSQEVTVNLKGTGTATLWRRVVRTDQDGGAIIRVAIGAGGIDEHAMVAAGWLGAGSLSAEELARIDRVTSITQKNEPRTGDWFEADATDGGRTAKSEVLITRERQPARVLVIDGQPSWDTRQLVRALTTMSDMEVSRAVATSSRRADGGSEFSVSLPSTVGGWARYDAVILGGEVDRLIDVRRGDALAKYVTESGGRVLLTRGSETVTGARPAWLSAIEPVAWTAEFADGGRLSWRGEGEESHVVTGRWQRGQLLASATAWATLESDRGSWPAVVEATVGRGKAVELAGGGMWRWWLDESQTNHAYRQFWRRVLMGRLLGRGEVGERLRLTAESPNGGPIFAGESVIVEAASSRELAWAPEAMSGMIDGPLSGAAPGESSRSVALVPRAIDVGHAWRGAWTPSVPGVYRIAVSPMEPGDAAATRTIQVLGIDRELADVSPDVSTLRAIAEPTGGVVMDASSAAAWSDRLINRDSTIRAVSDGNVATRIGAEKMWPIWNRAWVMSILFAVLLVEWSVRRWHGWR